MSHGALENEKGSITYSVKTRDVTINFFHHDRARLRNMSLKIYKHLLFWER